MAEIRDIAPGLWVWSRRHPDWTPDSDFDGPVEFLGMDAHWWGIAVEMDYGGHYSGFAEIRQDSGLK